VNLKKIVPISILFCLTTFCSARSEAPSCIDAICFDATREVSGKTLPLKGTAKLQFLKFDMYAGALYADANLKTPAEVLGDVPKALVLHYQRNIKVEWMNTAAVKIIKKNPKVDYEKVRTRVEEIGRAYKKVGKDDRYALVYEPGKGTSLYLNDQFVILIPGKDFQEAYFGIWLSEHPAKPVFRDKLLGIA
jgi:hypothetical protein